MTAEEQELPKPSNEISIKVCTSLREIRECVNLQRTIWNDPAEDLIPSALFVVANKIGGEVLLAQEGAESVGFALAFPAFRDDVLYVHSHMVGVVPGYQNRGLGRRLKWKQRELALERRIPLIEWTFDPLAIRNAYFNIVRLGATMRRFHPNLYGVTASPLHGGLPTDRLVAEWWLSSARVNNALAGRAPVAKPDAIRIVVPADIEDSKLSGSSYAADQQARLRMEFQQRFAQGYTVTAFKMEDRNAIYLLEPEESPAV